MPMDWLGGAYIAVILGQSRRGLCKDQHNRPGATQTSINGNNPLVFLCYAVRGRLCSERFGRWRESFLKSYLAVFRLIFSISFPRLFPTASQILASDGPAARINQYLMFCSWVESAIMSSGFE
jgi:hypothetical protein